MTLWKHVSGEMDWNSPILKTGNAPMRMTLYQASLALLTRSKRWTLKAWGMSAYLYDWRQ